MKKEEFLSRIQEVEERIGYAFRDKNLLVRCFTLSSADADNNERLEFFGDAVLEFAVSEWLYKHTDKSEGVMNDIRKVIVQDENLSALVLEMGLDKYLIYEGDLGKKPIASLMEALFAGVYIDGGKSAVHAFLKRNIRIVVDTRNYRGELQEKLSAIGEKPTYAPTLRVGGTDNDPIFTATVSALGFSASATVKGKKSAAEREAAKELLKKLTEDKK